MLTGSSRTLFKHWFRKGINEEEWNDGSKFFCFYLCLNILMANLSKENSDRKMLNWVKRNDSVLSRAFAEKINHQPFVVRLEELKRMSPVSDARTGVNGDKSIRDINNMGQVLEVVYKIRCNFFHGNKLLTVDRNRRLIETSTYLLKYWMEDIHTQGTNS